jgi:hypothetical protein
MSYARVFSAALVAVVLSACQTLPQVPFDRTAAGPIASIAVLTPAASTNAEIIIATTPGMSLGLVGALIEVGMRDNRMAEFAKVAASKNFSGPDRVVQHTIEALKSAGYAANASAVSRKEMSFLKQYPSSADVPGDAFLDITMYYGYLADSIVEPYRPWVIVDCKLVRASDKATLMQRTITYNNTLWRVSKQSVSITPDPEYEFDDFDALTADPDRAIAGLDKAIAQVAGTIGTMLR